MSLLYSNFFITTYIIIILLCVATFVIIKALIEDSQNYKKPIYYVDMGKGLDWFQKYEESGLDLETFFNLNKSNRKKISVTVQKVGRYINYQGKLNYVAIAKYRENETQDEITFYFPAGEYNPEKPSDTGGNYGIIGEKFKIYVDNNDYSKYSDIF